MKNEKWKVESEERGMKNNRKGAGHGCPNVAVPGGQRAAARDAKEEFLGLGLS